MSDKIMLNFRCPTSVLEVIDSLGKERYPANNKHGCDRSKTLIDIMRAGIEALSDGSVVLPAPAFVRQQPNDVRQSLSDSSLEARITEIVQRQTEPLFAEKFSALEERLEKLSAARDGGGDESLRQELAETKDGNERWEEIFSQLQGENEGLESELRGVRSQLETERADRQQLQAQLAELQQRLDAAEQNPDSAIESPERADQTGEIVNFLKELLPPDTKWPKRTIPTLRKFLEAAED